MKTFVAAVVCLAILTSAVAIQAQTVSPQVIKLELDDKDVNLIGEALGALPYNRVALLMQKLQIQINAQVKPNPAPMPTNPNAK